MKIKSNQKPTELKYSRKERRKKFSDWIDLDFMHRQNGTSKPVGGCAEVTNLICDRCEKKVAHLKGNYVQSLQKVLLLCDKCRSL